MSKETPNSSALILVAGLAACAPYEIVPCEPEQSAMGLELASILAEGNGLIDTALQEARQYFPGTELTANKMREKSESAKIECIVTEEAEDDGKYVNPTQADLEGNAILMDVSKWWVLDYATSDEAEETRWYLENLEDLKTDCEDGTLSPDEFEEMVKKNETAQVECGQGIGHELVHLALDADHTDKADEELEKCEAEGEDPNGKECATHIDVIYATTYFIKNPLDAYMKAHDGYKKPIDICREAA